MIERAVRLRSSRDVQRVYDDGKSWVHPLFVLIVLPNDVGFSRVGVTASRSVGSAVERNRAKRLLREAARHLYSEFESKGWDIMLIARPRLVNAKEIEVEKALLTLLERAGL
ncbi:MAG: ribonuclease P protein component [Anaerolineae bacterium]|nr:ribonuclease P protein component [Chloroflexota bacterium]